MYNSNIRFWIIQYHKIGFNNLFLCQKTDPYHIGDRQNEKQEIKTEQRRGKTLNKSTNLIICSMQTWIVMLIWRNYDDIFTLLPFNNEVELCTQQMGEKPLRGEKHIVKYVIHFYLYS